MSSDLSGEEYFISSLYRTGDSEDTALDYEEELEERVPAAVVVERPASSQVQFSTRDIRLMRPDGTMPTPEEVRQAQGAPISQVESPSLSTSVAPEQMEISSPPSGVQSNRKRKRPHSHPCPIQGCTCKCKHIRRHVLIRHLPSFLSSTGIRVWQFVKFLDFLRGIFHEPTRHSFLSTIVKRRLYSDYPVSSEFRETPIVKEIAAYFGEDSSRLTISPPNGLTAFVHFRTLSALLNSLSYHQRDRIYRYVPTRQTSTIGSASSGAASSSGIRSKSSTKEASHVSGVSGKGAEVEERHPTTSRATSQSIKSAITIVASTEDSAKRRKVESRVIPTVSLDVGGGRQIALEEQSPLPCGFDSHFHLDLILEKSGDSSFDSFISKQPSPAFQLVKGLAIYCDPVSYPTPKQRVVMKKDGRLLYAFGIHPKLARLVEDAEFETTLEILDSLLGNRFTVALGEVGLDYTKSSSRVKQRLLLRKLLPLAPEHHLPVVIHCRDSPGQSNASKDCRTVLEEFLLPHHTVILHSCNLTIEEYQLWAQLFNIYIGVSGLITYPTHEQTDLHLRGT